MAAEQLTVPPTGTRVAVVGDVMIDDNMYLEYTGREDFMADRATLVSATSGLGGAGNVAANTAGLGLPTALVGMVGDDGNGARLTGLARSRLNVYPMLFVCDGVKTPRKARLYDRHCLRTRIDDEGRAVSYYATRRGTAPLKPTPYEAVRHLVASGVRVICTVDHAKGFLMDDGGDEFPASAFQRELRTLDVPLIVDPKPNRNWPYIGGRKVILKMNHHQLNDVVGKAVGEEWIIRSSFMSPSEARVHFNKVRAAISGSRAIHCDWLWLTYGKAGMSIGPMDCDWSAYVDGSPDAALIDVEDIKIDATGCGDTCTAVMANAVAANGYTPEAILEGFLQANYAAGLASRHLGCHVLTRKAFEEVERGVAASEDYRRVLGHVA